MDKKYLKSPLVIDISRFDTKQKGCDIALKAVEQVLKENKNSAFIFAFPQISNFYPKEKLTSFVKEVVNKPENRGRFVLLDSYVPVNQYMAAADFFCYTQPFRNMRTYRISGNENGRSSY